MNVLFLVTGLTIAFGYKADPNSVCWSKFSPEDCTDGCVWHNNVCMPAFNEANCYDGDVRLSSYPRGRPQVHYDGEWKDLCADMFADNKSGAKVFCHALGFNDGKIFKVKRRYKGQAINVGRCGGRDKENGVFACTEGANDQRISKRCKNRRKKGIDILCFDPYTEDHEMYDTHVCNGEKPLCTDEREPLFCAETVSEKRCNKKKYAALCNKSCGRCSLMNSS